MGRRIGVAVVLVVWACVMGLVWGGVRAARVFGLQLWLGGHGLLEATECAAAVDRT